MKAISGILYTAVARYLGIFVSIIITSILARILAPDDFGVIAISSIAVSFISLITVSGFQPAIVQNKTLDNNDVEHIFCYTLKLGLVAAIVLILLAPFIAKIYSDERLISIMQIMSINVFFSCCNIVPNALFFKNKQFKLISKRTIFVSIVTGLMSVSAVYLGFGIYSLVVSPILSSIIIFFIGYKYYPIKFDKILISNATSVQKVKSYAVYQLKFNILNFTYRNVDKLIIGNSFGMTSLGYYEKSYRLMMLPLENIPSVITPVLHPYLSNYQNDLAFIEDKCMKFTRILAFIGFPLTALIYNCSDEIIFILYGENWGEAVPIFKILSLSIGVQLIQSAVGVFFQATNSVKEMFHAGVWAFIITITSIAIGIISHSIILMCILLSMAFTVSFIIYYFYLIQVVFKGSLLVFFKKMIKPISIGLAIFSVLYIIDYKFEIPDQLLSLITKIAIASIIVIILTICGAIKKTDLIYKS